MVARTHHIVDLTLEDIFLATAGTDLVAALIELAVAFEKCVMPVGGPMVRSVTFGET
jgi:hypothetical protein